MRTRDGIPGDAAAIVRNLMAALAAALERALQLHERGQLDEAETPYRQILARMPRHPETLHLLGALHHQRGRHETAIELVSQAVAAATEVVASDTVVTAARIGRRRSQRPKLIA